MKDVQELILERRHLMFHGRSNIILSQLWCWGFKLDWRLSFAAA